MKRMIHGIKQQHREHPVLIYTLLITGIISVVIPAIQFLVDGEGFPPDEAREHVTESLAKVRNLKRQLQDIENQLGAVHDAIDTESIHTLSQDEMGAMGPVRLTEVQEAQKQIISVARRLSDEGTIVLAGRGGDDFV